MKKIVKMSLVAAVAVAGLTTANAKPLEEAIKDVDVSGTVVYRYNDYEGQKGLPGTTNYYKVGLNLSSKVNDDVKFNSRFTVNQPFGGWSTTNNADSAVDVQLTQANFSYTGLANTTVIVGKQGLQTPWTNAIDSDGKEHTGTGVLALANVGPVTAAAGYINQHNIDQAQIANALGVVTTANLTALGLTDAYIGSRGLTVGALIAQLGPVNAQAWYLDHQNTFDAYFVKAAASFDLDAVKLGLYAQHSDLSLDSGVKNAAVTAGIATTNDYSLTKAGISAKAGIFGASYTYGKTGKDGSGVVNNVSQNGMIAWTVSLDNETTEANMHLLTADAQVMDNLNVALKHAQLKRKGTGITGLNDEEKETYAEITYMMSKNLKTYVRLGSYKNEVNATSESESRGRLQVQYSF